MNHKEPGSQRRPSRRYSLSTVVLLAALLFSVFQYNQKNEVSWLTDGFRFIAAHGKNILGSDSRYWLDSKYEKYKTIATETIDEVSSGVLESVPAAPGTHLSGKVVAVSDGDTIRVLDERRVEHIVRLTGIDAPERDQPFGKASARNLASLLSGRKVLVKSTGEDDYNRLLGKVLLGDRDINLAQVEGGYAWWYRYYASQQSGADQKAYERAETAARSQRRGLWADPQPINPYQWRKSRR
jgi:endonuclease YncB( thermonuclease family)